MGGVCKVIFMSNPTVVLRLRLGWGLTTNKIPHFVRLADISTIYKGKGPKNELIKERGIVVVTILGSILMKLKYFDYYFILDKSMSDSQVGAMKNRNIKNHMDCEWSNI